MESWTSLPYQIIHDFAIKDGYGMLQAVVIFEGLWI
jgi:hypothetical protein